MLQPRLKSVEPMDAYKLRLVYETGEVKIFDVAPIYQRSLVWRAEGYGVFPHGSDAFGRNRNRVEPWSGHCPT